MRTLMFVALTVLAVGLTSCASQSAKSLDQRVSVQVTDEGFVPAVVTVKAGQPVTMLVKRVSDKTCATEVVMKDYNINQPLPLNQEVEITFTPKKSGDVVYACAMDMYRGTVRVE